MMRYILLCTILSCTLCHILVVSAGDSCPPQGRALYGPSTEICNFELLEVGNIECGDYKKLQSFTNEEPHVSYQMADSAKYYTLLMVDPDAPNRQTHNQRYWLHWLVSDIQGEDFDTSNGDTIKEYNPPTPPKGSGVHRYQLFLFEHNHVIQVEDDGQGRGCFDLIGFVEKYHLGKPVAANEFETSNEG